MANVIPTVPGQPVRLNLQISDGEDSLPLVVKAFVRDPGGQLIFNSPVTLTHVGFGLFKNALNIMPDLPEVTAQYVVYEEDGVTPAPYSIDLDQFTREDDGSDVDVESIIARLSTETIELEIE